MTNNIKLTVTYFDKIEKVEKVISSVSSIYPLNNISKEEMGSLFAKKLASTDAGHENIFVSAFHIDEL